MAQIAKCFFAPDLDSNWSVAPGAITAMDGFAPLQTGAYGSIGTQSLMNITSSDIIKGKLFRQIDGTVRLLVFRTQNIDEYTNTGTRTNRGTGYNVGALSGNWQAAAWGNQIIAVNGSGSGFDPPQSSTGAGFSALSGSPPRATLIASNVDFVMLADVNDGGSNNFTDMVWWSGLRNPTTWTPALATQAGNVRLLDSPGPIRQLVAFRDTFVAFKDNAIFVGEYVGPPPQGYIFSWRMISNKIGCISPDSVAEVDGKLIFLHSSGFYQFDGQSLVNIGRPVFQNFLTTSGYISGTVSFGDFTGVATSEGPLFVQAMGDDIEGVYWIKVAYRNGSSNYSTLYGYNARGGQWGRARLLTTTAGFLSAAKLVMGSSADMKDFAKGGTHTDTAGRFWMIWNDAVTSTLRSVLYPAATTDVQATITTGLAGSPDGAQKPTKFYWRTLYPSTSPDTTMTLAANGYSAERSSTPVSSYTPTVNTEFDDADLRLDGRFITMQATWTLGSTTVLAGVGWGKDGRPR